MAAHWEGLGLDPKRLERRLIFLLNRALVHDESKTSLAAAFAATLRRDAAAINLLLGRPDKASPLFAKAGRQLADLGVYAGYSLMSLAQPKVDAEASIDENELNVIEESLSTDAKVDPFAEEGDRLRRLRSSRNSPQQLLNLFQAVRGGRRGSLRASRLASLVSARLSQKASTPVASVGIPLAIYLRLYDHLSAGDVSPADRNSILGFSVRRDELVSVAQTDTYHWRLIQKPAELIDLDLVSLGIAAIGAGEKSESVLFNTLGERGPAAHLPFDVARELYQLK